ncbi:MAG: Uma2 family endonuclease [Pseudomonadales bacterium]|jgi:Uma2 family endonuclease|nr:Uma2 family endonuclease [Pseudomonadales bacterium]
MGNAAVNTTRKMTAEEFLAWEAEQPERHEFIDGEIFAMTGATKRHVMVAGNAYMALRQHLAGTPCRTYMADVKVAAATANKFFYPDVVVTCSEADHQDRLIVREPTLIIEVLSPSTAGHDLFKKFRHYQDTPSLREIAFIDPDERSTTVFRRGADGLWVLHRFDDDAAVRFESVDLTIPATVLFAEVD